MTSPNLTSDPFIEFLPDYANDIKSNLAAVLTAQGSPGLTEKQMIGAALAAGYATRHENTARAIEMIAKDRLSAEEIRASKVAACMMAMNNVYYRFTGLIEDPDYKSFPTKLRMSSLAAPGIERTDFEVLLLAVSILNGCSHCVNVHVKKLAQAGFSKEAVQSVARIASVVNAAAQAKFVADSSQ